jgi:hypothetical protein
MRPRPLPSESPLSFTYIRRNVPCPGDKRWVATAWREEPDPAARKRTGDSVTNAQKREDGRAQFDRRRGGHAGLDSGLRASTSLL